MIMTLRANMSYFPNFSVTQPFVCWIKMTVRLSLDICTLFSPFQMWLLRMIRRRVKRIIYKFIFIVTGTVPTLWKEFIFWSMLGCYSFLLLVISFCY